MTGLWAYAPRVLALGMVLTPLVVIWVFGESLTLSTVMTLALVVGAILILVTRTAWFEGLFLKYGPDKATPAQRFNVCDENEDEDDQEYPEEMD
jgi:hypothetical protein